MFSSFIVVSTTLITEDPLKSINYQRLLTTYIEKCRYDSELWQIVNYFYLLKQIKQRDGENCFIESLGIFLIKLNDNDIDDLLERLFGVNRQGILTEVSSSPLKCELLFIYFFVILRIRLVSLIILILIQMLLLLMLHFILKKVTIWN